MNLSAWKIWLCSALLTIAYAAYALPLNISNIPQRDIDHLPQLQVGDWVLRMGTTADSRIIRHVGKGRFSHLGVVVRTKPELMVIHATTDDGYDKKNQVLLTKLSEFLSPKLAQYYAIVRPNFITAEIKKKIGLALQKRQGEAFVLADKSQANLYCTTLIEQEIKKYKPAFKPQWQQIDVALFEGKYLFPDAFYNYPNVTTIYEYNTKSLIATQ